MPKFDIDEALLRKLAALLNETGLTEIEYVGRPYRASPSEGYPGAHAVEQERIVREALGESRNAKR